MRPHTLIVWYGMVSCVGKEIYKYLRRVICHLLALCYHCSFCSGIQIFTVLKLVSFSLIFQHNFAFSYCLYFELLLNWIHIIFVIDLNTSSKVNIWHCLHDSILAQLNMNIGKIMGNNLVYFISMRIIIERHHERGNRSWMIIWNN